MSHGAGSGKAGRLALCVAVEEIRLSLDVVDHATNS